MLWDPHLVGWIPIDMTWSRTEFVLAEKLRSPFDVFVQLASEPSPDEPMTGYYDQVAFQPTYAEPKSGYYEDLIKWPQKSTPSS